jgi:hypothetical protein
MSDGFVGFRCTVALKNQLVEAAELAGLSLTDLIVLLLREGLRKELPQPTKPRSVL